MFWLCFFWIFWCVMHSLLVDLRVSAFIKKRLRSFSGYYRFGYNLFSFFTLIPLVVYTAVEPGSVIFSWSGWIAPLRFGLLLLALFFFVSGARGYDLNYFLGLEQIRGAEESLLLGDKDSFSEAGVFGFIRHPWYAGSLLLVWSFLGSYHLKSFLVAVLLSIYIVIGTLLEERKILANYGEAYTRYQRRVSMFLPLKWLKRKYF